MSLPDPSRLRAILLISILACFILHASAQSVTRFERNGKYGVRGQDGKILIKPEFESIGWSDGSFSALAGVSGYRKGDRWGLIRLNNRILTEPEFITIRPGADGARPLIVARREVRPGVLKAGCIDADGGIVLDFRFEDILMHEDRAIVMTKDATGYRFGICDLKGQWVLDGIWSDIRPAAPGLFAVSNGQRKLALYDKNGQPLTGFELDSIGEAFLGRLPVHSGHHTGLIGTDGKWVRPPAFKSVQRMTGTEWRLKRYDRWVLIDHENRELRSLEADSLLDFGNGLLLVGRGRYQGLVNEQLREVWPMEYDRIAPGVNGWLIVGKAGKTGISRTDGRFIVPPEYDRVVPMGQTLALVRGSGKAEKWSLFQPLSGTVSAKSFDGIRPEGRLFRVRRLGFEGLASADGGMILDCVYDSILDLSGNQAGVRFLGKYGIVGLDGSWQLLPQDERLRLITDSLYIIRRKGLNHIYRIPSRLLWFTPHAIRFFDGRFEEWPEGADRPLRMLDRNGREVVSDQGARHDSRILPAAVVNQTPSFPQTEGLRGFFDNGKYGFKDAQGRLRIPNRYDSILPFSDGLAAVKLNGKWGFVDASDRLVIQPRYDLPGTFRSGVVVVRFQGRYGIADRKGYRLEPVYDELTATADGKYFIIRKGNQYGLASDKGEILLEARFQHLQLTGSNHVLVRDGLWGVITRTGLSVIPIRYEDMRYLPESDLYLGKVSASEESIR